MFGGTKKQQQFLSELPLFRGFTEKEVKSLTDLLKEKKLEGREALFDAGQPGDAAYIIYSGRISVFVTQRSGRIREVATLNQGDILGQVALLDGGARSARCAADNQGAVVLELKRDKFNKAFDKGETVAFKLLDVLTRVLVRQFRNANERLSALAKHDSGAQDPRGVSHPEVEALFSDMAGQMNSMAMSDVDLDGILR